MKMKEKRKKKFSVLFMKIFQSYILGSKLFFLRIERNKVVTGFIEEKIRLLLCHTKQFTILFLVYYNN